MDDENPIRHIINEARRHNLKEIRHYDTLLAKYNCKEAIISEFHENIKNSVRSKAIAGRSKYQTYLAVNPGLETPQIYSKVRDRKQRCMLAKLRTSSHNLQIEMGRRTRTAREERRCQCREVEDEQHFLQECQNYRDIREKYNTDNIAIKDLLTQQTYSIH